MEDAEHARRRFLARLAHAMQWSLRNWARQHAGLTQRLGPQVVAALQRLLDEVHGAELAVLNTNQGYAQVLERIVAGRLNKQIADDLGISIKTVEAHRANIMEKLNANTVADLLKIALGAQTAKA